MDILFEIQLLKQELLSLENLKKRLPATIYEENHLDLEQRLNRLHERVIEKSIQTEPSELDVLIQARQVQVDRDSSGNLIITGDANTVILAPDESPSVLMEIYLRALAEECGRLPLGLLNEEFARPDAAEQISLTQIYTDLDVVSPPRPKETQGREFLSFGLNLEMGAIGNRLALLDAISQTKTYHTVLIGSPGSGKTTFVNCEPTVHP